jgi:hypothetical protein
MPHVSRREDSGKGNQGWLEDVGARNVWRRCNVALARSPMRQGTTGREGAVRRPTDEQVCVLVLTLALLS